MHPNYKMRGKRGDEFNVGDVFYTASRTITEADVVNFAALSNDWNPVHCDEEFAKNTVHGTRIAHGALGIAIITGLNNASGLVEGTAVASLEYDVKFKHVLRIGDTVTVIKTVTDKRVTSSGDKVVLTTMNELVNQDGVVCTEMIAKMLMVR